MPEGEEKGFSASLVHLSEIINYAIIGIVALLTYWPFVWIFLKPEYLFEKPGILNIFVDSYIRLVEGLSSWMTFPILVIALPCIGLLNKAILSTFIETLLLKKIFSYGFLAEISENIRNFSIKTLWYRSRLISNEKLFKIDTYFHPSWKLSGTFDFVGFRYWLIKDSLRRIYWDWEHFLEWTYLFYYQNFIMFFILYLTILIYKFYKFSNYYSIENYLSVTFFLFILVSLTFASYRDYLIHHIVWVRTDLRFYLDYIIEEREDVSDENKDNLKKFLVEENYEKVQETLMTILKI